MASLNKVTLIGNLGQSPEMRYLADGRAATTISLATSDQWTHKASGEKREATEWHRVVFYDRLAEVVGEYATKGRSMYVEGKLHTRKWEDKDGVTKYSTEVVASSMQFLGGHEGRAEGAGRGAAKTEGDGAGEQTDIQPPALTTAARPSRKRGAAAAVKAPAPADAMDDIPF